jgi:hypothetical protein
MFNYGCKFGQVQKTIMHPYNQVMFSDGRWLIISKEAQIFGSLYLVCFYNLFIAKLAKRFMDDRHLSYIAKLFKRTLQCNLSSLNNTNLFINSLNTLYKGRYCPPHEDK